MEILKKRWQIRKEEKTAGHAPKLVSKKLVACKPNFTDSSRDWDLTNPLEVAEREGKQRVTRHVGGFERINKAYDSQRIVHLAVSHR